MKEEGRDMKFVRRKLIESDARDFKENIKIGNCYTADYEIRIIVQDFVLWNNFYFMI